MKIIGIVSLIIVIEGQSDDYVATWSSAHLRCAGRGGLFVNHGASLEHLRGVISTTPIWLGGRRVHTSWAWADGKLLYEAQGCFKRPPNLNLQYHGITEVFDCFLSCKSVYKYGIISGDRCTCIDYIGNLSRAGQDSCNQPCARNFGETCGGSGFISIYQRSTDDFPFSSELNNTDFSDCGYLSEDRNQIVIRTASCGKDITEFKRAFCKDPGRTIEPENYYKTWEMSCHGSTKAHVTRADNLYLTPPKYFWIGLNRTTTWIWDDGTSAEPEVGTVRYGEKRGGCLAAYEDEAKKIYLTALPCKTKLRVVCVHGVPPHVSTSTTQIVTSLKETIRTASTEQTTSTTVSIRELTPTIAKSKATTTSLPSTTVKTTTFEQTTKTTTSPTFKPTTTTAPTTVKATVLKTTSTTSKPTTTSITTFIPTPTTTTTTPTTRLPTLITKHPTRTTTRPPTTTEPSTPTTAHSTSTLEITKSTLQPPTTLKTTTITLNSSTTSYTTNGNLKSPTKQSNQGHNNSPTTASSGDKTSQRVTSILHPVLGSTDKPYGQYVGESTVSTEYLPTVGQTSSSTNKMTGQRLQVTPTESNQGLQSNGLYIGLGVAGGVVLLILLIIILAVITRTRGGQSKIYRVLLRSRRSLSQHSNSSTASKDNLVDKSFWGKTAKRVKLQSVTTDDRIIKWRDDNWGFEMEDGDDSVFSEPPSPVQNGQIASVGVTTRASLAIPDPLRSVHFEDELEKRRSQISTSGKVD